MGAGAGEALPSPPFDFLSCKVSRCKAGRAPEFGVIPCMWGSVTAPEGPMDQLGPVESPGSPDQTVLGLLCFDPHLF